MWIQAWRLLLWILYPHVNLPCLLLFCHKWTNLQVYIYYWPIKASDLRFAVTFFSILSKVYIVTFFRTFFRSQYFTDFLILWTILYRLLYCQDNELCPVWLGGILPKEQLNGTLYVFRGLHKGISANWRGFKGNLRNFLLSNLGGSISTPEPLPFLSQIHQWLNQSHIQWYLVQETWTDH